MKKLNLVSKKITFIEHPNYISMTYMFSGCQIKCRGCHTIEYCNPNFGELFTDEMLIKDLESNIGYIQNIVFLGGEWKEDRLIELCKIVNRFGMKRTLYTGSEDVSINLKNNLDYLKIGPYVEELGGLSASTTNQKMYNLETGENITSIFWK